MPNSYVSLTGFNTNDGLTALTPKRNFANAIALLNAGNTMFIRGGIYDELIDTGTKAGVSGSPITIRNYPGEVVRLKPVGSKRAIQDRPMQWFVWDGLIWDGVDQYQGAPGAGGVYGQRCSGYGNVTFQNFEWVTLRAMILVTGGSHHVTFRNCSAHEFTCVQQGCVTGDRFMAFYIHDGNDITVEGCDIYNNIAGGMQLQPGPLSNVIVRNNRIHHNKTINANSGIGGVLNYRGTVAEGGGPVDNTQIYNNLMYENGMTVAEGTNTNLSPGINIHSPVATTNTKVYNNVCYRNNGYGIHVGTSTGAVVQNNICYQNKYTQLSVSAGNSSSNNVSAADPLFVSPSTGDFRLSTGSPAINAGINLTSLGITALLTDIAGVARPSTGNWEIGAYEVTAPAGQTYYVSPSGSNSNDGLSAAQSWLTPQHAVTTAASGSTIILRDGTYSVSGTTARVILGAVGKSNITLMSENQYGAKLLMPNVANSNNAAIVTQGGGWTIDGLEISGGTQASGTGLAYSGIWPQGTTDGMIIRNCKIHDIGRTVCSSSVFGFTAIYGALKNVTIENNIFYAIGRLRGGPGAESGCTLTPGGGGFDANDHAVYIRGAGITNCLIRRNVFYDSNRGFCIQCTGVDGVIDGTKIYHNVFADAAPTAVTTPWGHIMLSSNLTNTLIKNNISYAPHTGMVDFFSATGSGNVINFNLCTKAVNARAIPSGYSFVSNLPNITPTFISVGTRDYRLASGSRGIDEGNPISGMTFNGTAPDMGYQETAAGGAPDITPPSVPTGFTVT